MALGRLKEDEELLFEAHVLECDACFEDLRALDRTRYLIREYVDASPVVLEGARAVLKRRQRIRALAYFGAAVGLLVVGFLVGRLF